jgi:sugar phosphate isomerase/epimerase
MAISPLALEQMLSAGETAATVLAAAQAAGISLSQLDGMSSWAPQWYGADLSPALRERFNFSARRCLELAEQFRLDSIVAVGLFDLGALPLDALIDAFGTFCDAAASRGIRVELEFVPYWGIPDLATAWKIVSGAGRPNSGIMIDTWHFQKGSVNFAADLGLLATIPARYLWSVQLADAMVAAEADSLRGEGRLRRFPGDGELALEQVVAIVAGKGGLRRIGAEIAGVHIDGLPVTEAGRLLGQTTRDLLSAATSR